MTHVPEPPNYPPAMSPQQAPELTVVLQTETAKPSRWDWGWLQVGQNTKCLLVSVVIAPIWAAALRDVRTEQHEPGAWFMAGAALCLALWLDRRRKSFLTRTLVWTTALGACGALPVFTGLVALLTGSR
ncbi:hypothetical protein OG786_21045 [Streptomyces sp. NBC_00101]|uniref:hypothetical protein n=1 Tax=Streptomyces sp. NBC_00101 TaxID=2975651 RepID=UPI0032442A23